MSGLTQRFNGVATPSAEMDNAIAYAYVMGANHQRQRITGFTATYNKAVTGVKRVTIKRGAAGDLNGAGPLTATDLAIGSTDTKVSSTLFQYQIGGVAYQKAAVTAGTTLAAGTIPADTWGLYLFSINASGTIACTAAADNFTTGYASEADAIAALPATPANQASMGYATVLTASGQDFIGGTDGLEGGASGNVATTTNYTSTDAILPSTVVYTYDHLFTNGNAVVTLPGVISTGDGECLSIELAASGTGSTTGIVTAFTFAE